MGVLSGKAPDHGALAAGSEVPAKAEKDAKSQLQELAMRRGVALRYWLVARTGPDHAPEMTHAVAVDGFGEAEATAGSRKQAEQMAAAELPQGSTRGQGMADSQGGTSAGSWR